MRRPSPTALILTLLLVWVVGLRAWYATKDPNINRFFDEKYSIPNVYAALEEGSLKPVRFAYLRLNHLPQVAVLGAIEAVVDLFEPGFSWFEGKTLRPAGFLISRWLQALIGSLSVLLTFLIGRRLFSSAEGLVAAFLVACVPGHLVLSGVFKPDALVVTTVLLAFIWSLDAVERPTIGRYLLAGLGIGLAVSTKPTAGTIAIPLILGAVILGVKARRHLLGLVLAGLTSVALFLALNPYPRYLKAFESTYNRYVSVAARKGTLDDPVELLRQLLAMVFKWPYGIWIGFAAAGGLVLLAVRVWTGRSDRQAALREAMLLIFPLSFAVLYCLVTRNLLPNNLAPLLPFTSLAAALLLLTAWRAAAHRLPWLSDRRFVAILVTGLALSASYRVHARVYGVLIPTTGDRALEALAAERTSSGTWIRWELEGSAPKRPPRGRPKAPPRGLLIWRSPLLTDVAHRTLDLFDAEVFPLVRTKGQGSEFYRARMESSDRAVRIIEPAFFVSWGPALVIVQHGWRPREPERVALTRENDTDWFEYSVAPTSSSLEVAAIEFSHRRRRRTEPARVEAAGRALELRPARNRQRLTWTSERVPLSPEGAVTFRIRLPESVQTDQQEVVVRRWTSGP